MRFCSLPWGSVDGLKADGRKSFDGKSLKPIGCSCCSGNGTRCCPDRLEVANTSGHVLFGMLICLPV